MDGRYVEPRKALWAVAEILWQDASGTSFRAPATLEDTSPSGACIRVRRPFQIGSRLIVKWHREQFLAVARNCRSDGKDYLLGLLREPQPALPPAPTVETSEPAVALVSGVAEDPVVQVQSTSAQTIVSTSEFPATRTRAESRAQGRLPRPERKVMESKTLFPHFWRRQQDGDAPAKPTSAEATVNRTNTHVTEASAGPGTELLSYEDIYRAAGLMTPGSGYGIHKVVDMLNSERIRDLSKEVKRASVLMALDAAGISADELLTDATRRQNALNAYEAAQRRQLEDFEGRKAQENARIEEEMEKVRAHYAERVQANLDQVAKEKDALHNWQMAMQNESQRISEVIELCGKQPEPARSNNALAAAAGSHGTGKP